MINETIFDVDGVRVGVGGRPAFERATYEKCGLLHLVTFDGINNIFFPDSPGAVAFSSEAFARRAAEVISAGKAKSPEPLTVGSIRIADAV